jgi:ABC-2 type transport system ATP-binding protein
MSQKFSLYGDLTIHDNMKLYGTLYGLNSRRLKERIAEMSQFLHLEELMERRTDSLPWGWQQRLSLACASLHEPRILFLDEPTGSVDPLSRKNFWDVIRRFSALGVTIFVTTHHMDEAEYCHRISLMVDGAIAALDTPGNLKRDFKVGTLQEVFVNALERKRAATPQATGGRA